jgi:hypothetical protein
MHCDRRTAQKAKIEAGKNHEGVNLSMTRSTIILIARCMGLVAAFYGVSFGLAAAAMLRPLMTSFTGLTGRVPLVLLAGALAYYLVRLAYRIWFRFSPSVIPGALGVAAFVLLLGIRGILDFNAVPKLVSSITLLGSVPALCGLHRIANAQFVRVLSRDEPTGEADEAARSDSA